MRENEKHDDLLAETSEAQQLEPRAETRTDHLLAEHVENGPKDTRLRVQRRAYEIWQERGQGVDDALSNWLQAEAEINAAVVPSMPTRHNPPPG